ncbi:MAG: DegV family protein [Bacilli bacterium]|nr:DegV family protein [Mollicutes bacterium]MDY3899257.1 DegV family protein [Bacilli bacterium]
MLVLFTDTDTDLTPVDAKEYGYKLISMPYIIDEKVIYPYVDFETFDYKTFYDMLRSGVLPKTCGLSPEMYINYFEPEFKNGNDILYVHFSAAMSGTFNAMHLAIEELKAKYPERKIYTIDTKGITICSLNIIKEIGDMYKSGKTINDILKWSKTEVDKFATYFYADNLKFFKLSGRISNLSATLGTVFGIHPIIYMNSEGKMLSISKAKGKNKTLNKLVEYVVELEEDIKNHRVIIAHSDAIELAEELGGKLKQQFGDDLNIEYVVVNPTAGSHCGPSAIGVSFHAKHR